MIEVREARTWLDKQRFYAFSHRLYKETVQWREPVVWSGRRVLSPAGNEVMSLPHALLAAHENGRMQARAMVGYSGSEGFFTLFDACDNRQAIGILMDTAVEWLRARGIKRLFGPIAPTPVDLGGGVLCEGFGEAAALMDAYNAPYYGKHLEAYGFRKEVEWQGWRLSAERFRRDRYKNTAEWVKKRFRLSVCVGESPRRLAEALQAVCGNVEKEQAVRIVERLGRRLDARLCPVAYSGNRPVGIMLSAYESGQRPRILTLWISEGWRRTGVTSILFDAFMDGMERLGIDEADASLIRSDNIASVIGVKAAGGILVKRYFQYGLDV